jgi:hypothetical protein
MTRWYFTREFKGFKGFERHGVNLSDSPLQMKMGGENPSSEKSILLDD